ncbi:MULTISPECIES: AAA family ATPase [Bacillus subtilis group]|uniref:AAA family ATPase n=1 Tax=Bacillus subtilis group TaxID=653685 RepID=UPI001B933C43|nr:MULTISPECIES: AAA family ATPase [Bacillus subtilis group]MEC2189662.1 AAA family ATPase [Bacillus spizizenii]MEC2297433.1 AAA family ATPase [Bacillus subtilis]MEC2400495.1 AAA family ATPase [Bacillus subtilis]MED4660926.1 AAA family ATPase [Bacillus subtilis]MED4667504.1 AAA family ATPase [Bacillus subtilis]
MEKVVFAIPSYPEAYEELFIELENDFLVYKNFQSQESLYEFIQSNEIDYLIVEKDLKGEPFYDFLKLIAERSQLSIIIYRDNNEEISLMVKGEIDIPVFDINEFKPGKMEKDFEVLNELNEEKQNNEKMKMWEKLTNVSNDKTEKSGNVLAISGFKPGLGKTDIAISFSWWLSESNYKVALLGYNLQNDDLCERLGFDRTKNKGLVAAHELYLAKELSYQALRDTMVEYNAYCDVLIGPYVPEDTEHMTEDFLLNVIDLCRSQYDFIIVDTECNNYSIAYVPILKEADFVLVPCTTNVSDLYHLQRGIKNLKDRYDIPISKFDVILNKATEGGHIDEDIIMKNTGIECIASLPYSKSILRAAENEKPAVKGLRNRSIQKGMEQLTYRYVGRKNKYRDTVKPGILHLKKEVVGNAKRFASFGKPS